MSHNKLEIPTFTQHCKLICRHANFPLIFIIPLIITFSINVLNQFRLYTVEKSVLEITALTVLDGFLLICLVRFVLTKKIFFIWAGCLLLVLFIREIHPPGTSAGVYLGILVLFYIAHKHYHQFSDYFQDTRLINLMAIGFFTYFISVTIDQRIWKFIPGEEIAHVPLEESLEVVGHLLIGYALAFTSNKYSIQMDFDQKFSL